MAPACPSSAARVSRSSLIISDRPVSMTCRRNPMSSIGWSGNRTPRSIVYGKWTSFVSGSKTPMSTTCVSKMAWILSPTRSYIACMSSSAARPSWTLLMIASSAARWSVSVRRRFVSSNSRAFSSATPMLAASVLSSRSSASLKACAWMLSRPTTPTTRSPALIGTPSHDRVSVPPTWTAPAASCSSSVPMRSGRAGPDDGRGHARAELDDAAVEPLALVDVVREPDLVRRGVVQRDEQRLHA